MDSVCDELGFKWTHRLVGYGQVFRRRNGTRLNNMLVSQTWELLMCCQSSVLPFSASGLREGLYAVSPPPEEGRDREVGGGRGWGDRDGLRSPRGNLGSVYVLFVFSRTLHS